MDMLQNIKLSKGAIVALLAALLCVIYVKSFQQHADYRGANFGDSAVYICKAERVYGKVESVYASRCATMPIIDALAQQGPAYSVFLAPLQVFEDMVPAIRNVQLIIFVLGGFLLFRILRDKGIGEPAVGTVLYFAYLPLATYTSFVLTENLTAFLILLFLFLHTRAECTQNFRRYAFAIGLTVSLLMLVTPAFQYFSLITILFLAIYYYRGANSARNSTIALLLLGFFALYGPWLAAINSEHKKSGLIWQVTGERSIEASKVESYDLANSGYPRPSGGTVASPSAYESISTAPLESIGLRVEKFIRFVQHPAVVYHNEYIVPEPVLDSLHVLLVGAALVSLYFFLSKPANFIFALPFIYSVAIYTGYFSEERRFLLPVMPVVIMIATYGVHLLVQNHAFGFKQEILRTISVLSLVATGLALQFGLDGIDLGGGASRVLIFQIAGSVMILVACYICYPLLGGKEKKERKQVFVLFSLFAIAVPLLVHAHWYHPWMRWHAVVDKGAYVRQEIRLPEHLAVSDVVQANLQIDARYEPRYGKLVQVSINGAIISPLQEPNSHPRSLMRAGMRPYLGTGPNDADLPPPDWRLLPIPKELLSKHSLDVTIRVPENEEDASAIVYGSFFEGPERTSYYGPRAFLDASMLPQVIQPVHRESLWKYQTTGDIRLFDSIPLSGDRESVYVHKDSAGGIHEDVDDLSSYPFRQSGSYNIRVQIITTDGKEIVI